MFRSFDAILLNSPSWYRRPLVQTTALGLVFFCVFTAYTTIQFYAASIYGPVLAANSVCAVYTAFAVACTFAPAVTNKLGSRRTMLVGVLGYAVLVLCSLVYFWHHRDEDGEGGGGEDKDGWARLVVGGGAVLGVGAALLWTAQGRLILQYAAVADELAAADDGASNYTSDGSEKSSSSSKSGAIISRFWSVFQCSALVGGGISFAYYNSRPTGSTALYVVFLAFILAGAMATQLLLPPSMLRNKQSKSDFNGNIATNSDCTLRRQASSEDTPLLSNGTEIISPMQIEEEAGEKSDNKKAQDATSNLSWSEEARETLALFFTSQPMLLLSVLFFYTGFNQPYQQATFGNRFFNRRTIGIELIVFHLMEVIGAVYCGRALDDGGNERTATDEHRRPDGMDRRIEGEEMDADGGEKGKSSENESLRTRNSHHRRSSIRCLVVFVLVNTAGNALAFVHEHKSVDRAEALDISDSQSLWPSLAFACWGFADSQIQVYCYWLIGSLYASGEEHSRAVGFYKCVQSLGVSIGFYLTPTSRLSAMAQLVLSSGIFVVGTALSLLQQCTTLGGSSSAP